MVVKNAITPLAPENLKIIVGKSEFHFLLHKKGYILRNQCARGGGATAKTPPRNSRKMETTVQKMAIYGQKRFRLFSPLKRQKWLFYVAEKKHNSRKVKFVNKFTNRQKLNSLTNSQTRNN